MNSHVKAGAFSFISILTSLLTITGSVHAIQVKKIEIANQPNTPIITPNRDQIKIFIPLKCEAVFIKEFTQVPVITNTTNNVISQGKTIYVKNYYAGKQVGQAVKVTLTKDLQPGAKVQAAYTLSGDNNSCKAYY